MGLVTQILLFVSFAILGAAVMVVPPVFFGLSEQVSALLGVVVFFGAWQLQSLFTAHREAADTKRRLDELEDMILILRGDMERTRRDVDTRSKASGEKSDKLVSELKILHTLLKQVMSKELELMKGGVKKASAKKMAAAATAGKGEAVAAESGPAANKPDAKPVAEAEAVTPVSEPAPEPEKELSLTEEADVEDLEDGIDGGETHGTEDHGEEDHNDDQMTQAEIEELGLTPEEAALAMVDTPAAAEAMLEEKAVPVRASGAGAPQRREPPRGKKAAIRLIKREDQLLSVIRSSLSENRVDLYLQPIVGLPARRTVHYECFSRVRDEEGRIILPRQYMKVAENKGLIGTIDNLLLFRLIQLVRRLGRRKPEIRFFCNMSRYSMMDKEFFPQFIDFMTANEEFAGRLVFEISQEDYYTLDPDVTDRLLTLGRKGFGFSMDLVKDFERDFVDLGKEHFQFIKTDIKDLMATHPEDGDVRDFKALLRRNGMELIASRIENEQMVLEALDAQVELAQGYLFGEPASVANMSHEL